MGLSNILGASKWAIGNSAEGIGGAEGLQQFNHLAI